MDWSRPAPELERAVRAYNPVPGAWTLLDGAPLKIWSAELVADAGALQPEAHAGSYAPGETLAADAEQLAIACGNGVLSIRELQPAGSKRMSAAAFLAGRPLPSGTRLGD